MGDPLPTVPQQDTWGLGVTLYALLSGGDFPWGELGSNEQQMGEAIAACPAAEKVQQLMRMGSYSKGVEVKGERGVQGFFPSWLGYLKGVKRKVGLMGG